MIWLLTEGWVVWWVAAACFVLAMPPAAWLLVRRRARRAAARFAHGHAPVTSAADLREGMITIRGAASGTVRGDDHPATSESASHELPSVELDGVEVRLGGPPILEAGALERWHGLSPFARAVDRVVRPGDPVLARGRLRREQSTDYRGSEPRWILGGPRFGELPRLACAGRPVVSGPGWRSLVASAIFGALSFAALAYATGAVAMEVASIRHYRDASDPASVLGPAAVAAATPFHRDEALVLAARSLYPDTPARAAMTQTAADLERALTRSCQSLLGALLRDGGVHLAPDVAERCGDPDSLRLGARAALLDGRIERAAELARRAPAVDMPEPDPDALWTEVLAHLLSGDHRRSARALRAIAARLDDDPGRSGAYECLASSLDIRAAAEDEPNLAPLQVPPDQPGADACRLLMLDHFEPSLRRVYLAVDDPHLDFRYAPLADELALESVGDISAPLAAPFDYPVDLAVGRIFRERAPLGLDAAAVAALEGREMGPGVRTSRAAVASRLAGFSAVMGDTERALGLLRTAEEDLLRVREVQGADFEGAAVLAWLPLRRAATHLRAGNVAAARAELARAEATVAASAPARELAAVIGYLTDGTVEAPEIGQDHLGTEGLRVAARTRDGRALADWLRRHRRHLALPVAQLGSVHVEREADALARWLHRDEASYHCPTMAQCRLDAVAADATSRAIAARAIGEEALAERLEVRARSLRNALGRRDVAVTWALLGRLRMADADGYSTTP